MNSIHDYLNAIDQASAKLEADCLAQAPQSVQDADRLLIQAAERAFAQWLFVKGAGVTINGDDTVTLYVPGSTYDESVAPTTKNYPVFK